MSEAEETLGEVKIEGCTFIVAEKKSEPGVIMLKGVSCDLKKDKEKADRIIDALFGGKEVRYQPPKFVKEETSGQETNG